MGARLALQLSNVPFLATPLHCLYVIRKPSSSSDTKLERWLRLLPEILGGIATFIASILYHACADGTPRPECPLPWRWTYCLDFIFAYQLVMSAALYTRIQSGIEWKWISHVGSLCVNIGFVLLVDDQYIPILYGVMVLECMLFTGIRYWLYPEESCTEWKNTRFQYVVLAGILIGGAIWAQVDAVRIEWATDYRTLDGFWWRHSIWHICCGLAFWARCMAVAPTVPILLNLEEPLPTEFTLFSSNDVTPPYPTHLNFAV